MRKTLCQRNPEERRKGTVVIKSMYTKHCVKGTKKNEEKGTVVIKTMYTKHCVKGTKKNEEKKLL